MDSRADCLTLTPLLETPLSVIRLLVFSLTHFFDVLKRICGYRGFFLEWTEVKSSSWAGIAADSVVFLKVPLTLDQYALLWSLPIQQYGYVQTLE